MTPAFLTPLRLETIDDETWMVYEPLVYDSALIGRIVVPRGFVTDLDSTPRWATLSYSLVKGRGKAASVQHDWQYQTHEVRRQTADRVFFEALGVLGLDWRRHAMYRAVRWFGGPAYRCGPTRYRLLGNDAMPPMLPGDLA